MGKQDPCLTQLKQIAKGIALQFGNDCEVVIHAINDNDDAKHSILFIENGHVSGRKEGDGPSKVVLETLQSQKSAKKIKDHIGYLTRTSDGRVLKSATMYIRDETDSIRYILSINYDITKLLTAESAIASLTHSLDSPKDHVPEPLVTNVNDLLDNLITQSVTLIGKPAAMMTKDEKVRAIQFLNDSGAFLITKSGDKVASYFGISKYTLYSYIEVNNRHLRDE